MYILKYYYYTVSVDGSCVTKKAVCWIWGF